MYDYIRRTKIYDGDLFTRLMKSREVQDETDFLYPKIEHLADPFTFDNMNIVCERVKKAVASGEQITVYSDYDADGTCGAAILMGVLKDIGANANNYIPDRFSEGYGTNPLAIQKIMQNGTTLIITVDCGIKSLDDVELAKNSGVDVIIMDHHECEELPDTPYILNPKVPGESYKFKGLCGGGVAFQFARAMLADDAKKYVDIAAVATIGDIVDLVDDNRIIASVGIKKLKSKPNVGLEVLAKHAKIDLSKLKTHGISFGLVPRINSAGRMESAHIAYDLLTKTQEEQLESLAGKLCELNDVRREAQNRIISECNSKVQREYNLLNKGFIVVSGKDWEKGVVGLAAQSICDRYYRPSLVLSESDGILTGSARSIEGVNIYNVLKKAGDYYEKFGGHAQAAGLSLKIENLDIVKDILNESMAEMYGEDIFRRKLFYDETLGVSEASAELAKKISLMEPFGMGNPEPVFLVPDVTIKAAKLIGSGEHVKFEIHGDDEILSGVKFSCKYLPEENNLTEVAGRLSLNEFRGQQSAQLIAMDFRQGMPSSDISLNVIKEITAFARVLQNPSEYNICKNEDDFCDNVISDMSRSPIGTLLIVGSESGARSIDMSKVYESRYSPEAAFNIPEFCADNAMCMTSTGSAHLKNFRNLHLCGSFVHASLSKTVLLSKNLYNMLRREAAEYYVTDRQLEHVFKATSGIKDGFSSFSEAARHIAKVANAPFKKVLCALYILCEEKLLNVNKYDKMYFNPAESGRQIGLTRRAFDTLLPNMKK